MKLSLSDLVDPRLLALVEPSRAFYADRVPGRGPSSTTALAAARAALGAPVPVDPAPVEEVVGIDGRSVAVRIHTPRAGTPCGVLVELHGGGFYLGSAAASDVRNRELADGLGVAVVSVDYRLAPEHPWPAAPDDAETAVRWVLAHGPERFGTARVALTGFSAGATLAMATLLRLRDRGGSAAVAGAVLQFGTYDLSGTTPAGRLIAAEYFLDAYAGAAPDRTHPDLSPAFADHAGLPPVLMLVGDADILLPDNLALGAGLAAAGVDVDLRVYPEAPHGFTGHPTPMGRRARADIEAWLAERLTT